ncbi:MAG TPA: ATP-binding protein [Gemmataceae bacterium]|nr:ATP-binding protein [Gemmataceae bacterium]
MPRLIVIKGADEGRQFDLTGPTVGIGRDSGNAIRLHDTEVSRRHAELRLSLDGSSYRLVDRNSANGVHVNGRPIHDAILQPGDQLQIGQTVLVYSTGRREDRPPDPVADQSAGSLADRIRMITRQDVELRSAIVKTIGETEGSRILARAEDAHSPWLRTRLANLAILYEASQAVSHILDIDELLGRILELVFRSVEADRGCVMLLNADSGVLEPKAVHWRNPADEADQMAISRTITEHVLRERQGIVVSDAAHDSRFDKGQSIVRFGIREAICVPMKGRHETMGVLYLDTHSPPAERPSLVDPPTPPPGKFTEDHLALAIAVAHQAALAVEETRYYRAMLQAERLAAVGQTIAALSHHIKNILQGLRSGSDILKLGMKDKDDALLQQGWKIVEKNQGKIYNLVLDMLSYSKEREPLLEPAHLDKVAAEVADLMQGRAKEVGATLSVECTNDLPPQAFDPDSMHRALLNLVSNALDAVEGRTAPRVAIRIERDAEPDWALVQVRDNGVGIPAEKLADVFKPFVSTKGAKGTGLGLAVSRKIVREHGGDLTVASVPGVGSIFTIRLPMRSLNEPDPLATNARGTSLEPPEPD